MADGVELILPQQALSTVFDECDQFDQDETGGRVIGTFNEDGGKLRIRISGIIEAGPQARRSPVSFFQDGEYQEQTFRQIERVHPEIEHLGSWHTHHVNGLRHLSDGDVGTYQKTVNHPHHNTNFFYALLITQKVDTSRPLYRYKARHFLFRRGESEIYEIPRHRIEMVDEPLIWPSNLASRRSSAELAADDFGAHSERVYDQKLISEFFGSVRAFASPKVGIYWRGTLQLVDGSDVPIVVIEDSSRGTPTYSIISQDVPDHLKPVVDELAVKEFPSARSALMSMERFCNARIYKQSGLFGRRKLFRQKR